MIRFAAIAGLATIGLVACTPPTLVTEPVPAVYDVPTAPTVDPAADDCTTDHGYLVDGRLVVTIEHTEPAPCDLVAGQVLQLVWNARTEGPAWGGDASVAAAEQQALDAGCATLTWHNDGDYRLVAGPCDF